MHTDLGGVMLSQYSRPRRHPPPELRRCISVTYATSCSLFYACGGVSLTHTGGGGGGLYSHKWSTGSTSRPVPNLLTFIITVYMSNNSFRLVVSACRLLLNDPPPLPLWGGYYTDAWLMMTSKSRRPSRARRRSWTGEWPSTVAAGRCLMCVVVPRWWLTTAWPPAAPHRLRARC